MRRPKILLLSKYSRLGASSRLRSLQYLAHLNDQGFDITQQCLFDDTYLEKLYAGEGRSYLSIAAAYLRRFFTLTTISKYDLVWIEKEIFPYFPSIFEHALRIVGKHYVVDYDDAIFHNYNLSKKAIVRKILGHKIDTVMRLADCVFVGNQYLRDYAEQAGAKEIFVVPTVVDAHRYKMRSSKAKDQLTIGWIGSPSTQQYLIDMKDILREVCLEHNAQLLVVGATSAVAEAIQDVDVEIAAWTEKSEAALIQRMDIGIMPLKDGPWERGKCGYKLIQYMACCVPVLASPVGVNEDIVRDNRCGILATSQDEWSSALELLLSQQTTRVELGLAGRRAVEKTYSLDIQAKRIETIFQNLLDKRTAS